MLKHKPKTESARAILARVKKEMDEPREVESVRGQEDVALPDHVAEARIAELARQGKRPRSVHAQENAREAGE